jgi:carbamoyltransferase
MLVMGISCYYHDSAVALLDETQIKFAIHEERLSRIKHDARFPVLAIGHALEACGIGINELDKIVFYEDPALKLHRLWEGRACPAAICAITVSKPCPTAVEPT